MNRKSGQILLSCTLPLFVLACGHDQPSPEDKNQIDFRINNLAIQRGDRWVMTCRSLVEEYGESAVPFLIEALGATDAQIRRGCAYCLGHIGHPDAVDPLRLRLGDPDLFVQLEAAASLTRFKVYEGVPLLILALRHEKSQLVRAAAYQTLEESFPEAITFDPAGEPAGREAAVQRFEAWWNAHQKDYLD